MYTHLVKYIEERAMVSPDEMNLILKCFKPVKAAKKQILLNRGEVCRFGLIYRKILELSFIEGQKRTYLFQGYPALEKLKWLQKRYPKILTRVTNKTVASFLGVKPATLKSVKIKIKVK